MSSETIHKFETASARTSRIYGIDRFQRAITSLKGEGIYNFTGDASRGDDTIIIYQIGSVAVKYLLSPGLGSFPNTRESITLYGKREDRNNLKSKLLKKLENC